MLNEELILKMVEFDKGDPMRIQHFIKVYEFAHLIGIKENLDEETLKILDIAAIMHDIGIHPAEEKYGCSGGKYQEELGPEYAREMLKQFSGVSEKEIERVCYLIGHHHTYTNVEGSDYQILLEADYLVNGMEDKLSQEAMIEFRNHVFKTKTGIYILNTMYGLK